MNQIRLKKSTYNNNNNITDPLPQPVEPEESSQSCSQTRSVESGESCWSIAQSLQMPLSYFLKELNPYLDCGRLEAGQTVCIGK